MQYRKLMITINNPIDKGYTHEEIRKQIAKRNVDYWCMVDEIGGKGNTPHTHVLVFFESSSPCRKETLDRMFRWDSFDKHGNPMDGHPHYDALRGSKQECKDYILKQGKWEDTDKQDTQVAGTFEEYGNFELVVDKKEKYTIEDVYNDIYLGLSNYDLLQKYPKQMLNMNKFDMVRQELRYEAFKDVWRTLSVNYIHGKTGTGKTRGVMEKYGYSNVYRVTNYKNPFDSYKGQDVVIFEEFRGDLPLKDMLKYLDGYPVELPCRYNDKVACFTKVYILSNIPLEKQYQGELVDHRTREAWLRRIHTVVELDGTEMIMFNQYMTQSSDEVSLFQSMYEEEIPTQDWIKLFEEPQQASIDEIGD